MEENLVIAPDEDVEVTGEPGRPVIRERIGADNDVLNVVGVQ